MELPLFNRDKDWRLVRPKRVPVLEWLRALRHNLYCEWTLITDRMHHIALERLRRWETRTTSPFTLAISGHQVRSFFSGRAPAQACKRLVDGVRTKGIGPAFWPLVFVVGLTIGFGLKWVAEANITIGYEDYTLPEATTLYDLNTLNLKAGLRTPAADPKPTYPACPLL